MILHIIRCDGIDFCAIVQESLTAFPVDLHFSYIFDPVPMLEGFQIQEGSLLGSCYASGTSLLGVWAPFLDAFPSLQFNCIFSLEALTSRQSWMKFLGLLQW